jgi:EAL domain-containing protein (putative c-di-GMP-specific phosphodiesterase class I)
LETSQPNNRELSPLRRLGPPILCGLIGIFITIVIGNIPHNYSYFALGVTLIIFIVAHVLWFHKVIQSLRQDLQKTSDRPKTSPSSHISSRESDLESTHEILIEATFFQLLIEGLNLEHPPHLQALSLQDNKTHLIQTEGLVTLLREKQLEILTEPIVTLPQKRLTFFSCIPCVTVENGMIINLNTLAGSTNNLAFLQSIERMILFQTLQFVRLHHATHPTHGFVCSLPPSIYKDQMCLEEFIDFLQNSHFPYSGLIFEIPLNKPAASFHKLIKLSQHGVRFIGKWQDETLPENLADLALQSLDFIKLPYGDVSTWLRRQPRRRSLESLQQILEISPQVIISDVDQEQDLYHKLPLAFDYASGHAFGVPKSLYHIQV